MAPRPSQINLARERSTSFSTLLGSFRSKTLETFSVELHQLLSPDNPARGTSTIRDTVGHMLVASLCIRAEKALNLYLPTLDIDVGPGTVSLVGLDMREPRANRDHSSDLATSMIGPFFLANAHLSN